MSESRLSVRAELTKQLTDAANLAVKLRLSREEFLSQALAAMQKLQAFADEEEITQVG